MASTYTPQQALDFVKKYCRDVPLNNVDYQLCDIVNAKMWRYYPWRWARSALTSIALVDGQQDYTMTNTNVYRLLRVLLKRTDCTPDETRPPLTIYSANTLIPDLNPISAYGIEACSRHDETTIRLECAASISSAETWVLGGEFQFNPVAITPPLLDTAFAFPDQYFEVYVEGMKWKAWQFIGDPRAGAVVTDRKGNRTYTGQLGVFMQELADMAADEDFGDVETMVPHLSLGAQDW